MKLIYSETHRYCTNDRNCHKFCTRYETLSMLSTQYVILHKDSLVKLRISDAIDCTCTAGGWSRELNSAIRERGSGTGVVDALPVKYRRKRQGERVNEWLPICSIPLLERLVPRVQIYPCFTPLSLFPRSPGHPYRGFYHCAHASHLSTMGDRFCSPLILPLRV